MSDATAWECGTWSAKREVGEGQGQGSATLRGQAWGEEGREGTGQGARELWVGV